MMERKGGARQLADDLRRKEQDKYQSKLEERKIAADRRMVEIAQNNESEQKKKEDIRAKKEALKKEQERDALNKQAFREKNHKKIYDINDFNDNNVLSYVYETKLHKSYEYDKKKEENISKIMSNFPKEDKI